MRQLSATRCAPARDFLRSNIQMFINLLLPVFPKKKASFPGMKWPSMSGPLTTVTCSTEEMSDVSTLNNNEPLIGCLDNGIARGIIHKTNILSPSVWIYE